jgi:hypothetical protein
MGYNVSMGKGGSVGVSPSVSNGLLSDENALVSLAGQQAGNSQQLFNLTEPGLQTAENYYSQLATGDPGSVMRAIAPTAQAANQAAQGASSNIMANAPAGGEKNLALEQVDVNRGAQIASTASGATTGAPNALATLAGQGIGESTAAAGTGISGLSAGASALSSLGGLQLQGQQLQMEQKGQELGAFGGLAGDASQLGTGAMQKGGDLALAGALA